MNSSLTRTRQIFVLIHDRAVGVAVVAAVVALLDQRPRFLLFLLLRVDEFLDVADASP